MGRSVLRLFTSGACALMMLACERREAAPSPVPSASVASVSFAASKASGVPAASSVAATAVAPGGADAAPPPVLATEGCGAIMPLAVRAAKSIGHTSIVFKIELETNQKLAWKPRSKRGKERWRGEVAAAKLGDALAIPNVPPACLRTFKSSELAPLLPKGALDEVIANDDGSIDGAMIPWIEGLHFLPLEKESQRAATTPALAAQLSTLVVFDAITGNWDRYSGGNIGLDASGQRVLFIDNDAAFMEGAPPKELAANVARVEATQHFSRALVTRLRSLDPAKAFGTLPSGAPLLPESMLKTVLERTVQVLRIIDAKIAARSEDDVLSFP